MISDQDMHTQLLNLCQRFLYNSTVSVISLKLLFMSNMPNVVFGPLAVGSPFEVLRIVPSSPLPRGCTAALFESMQGPILLSVESACLSSILRLTGNLLGSTQWQKNSSAKKNSIGQGV